MSGQAKTIFYLLHIRDNFCIGVLLWHDVLTPDSATQIINVLSVKFDYFLIHSLTFWPHPLGQGCVSGQNICYHVAASVVSFNLICNMTIFWKSLILASAPPPKSTQRTRTQAFKLKSRLICFISIAALPACKISAKNINNCLSYCEIKIFNLWHLRWGQRGWCKTLTLPCLPTGTWQSWSIVRSC